MRHTAFALILAASLATLLPAADQQLVNMVMPQAKALAGINVTAARNSPLGTFLLKEAATSGAEFQKFVELTGFNPQTDLEEILVATLGTPSAPVDAAATTRHLGPAAGTKGLILARGTFNIEKISALAKSDGKQNVQIYNGATLISDPKSKTSTAMAFVSPTIAAVGDLDSVKAAVDRRNQVNNLDPLLTSRLNALSTSEDAWAVSIVPLSSFNSGMGADPMMQGALGGDLFKKITSTSGGIKFGNQIEISTQLVALDEKNAAALGDVVKFLVGMATMNAGGNKNAPAAVTTFLQSLSIEAQGNVLNVSVSVPEDQVESLIDSMQVGKPGAKI